LQTVRVLHDPYAGENVYFDDDQNTKIVAIAITTKRDGPSSLIREFNRQAYE